MQMNKVLSLISGLIVIASATPLYADEYKSSTQERPLKIASIESLERGAEKNMGYKGAYDYIAGGVDNEILLRQNITSFDSKRIVPRILQKIDTKDVDTSIEFMGAKLKMPVMIAPIAAHGFLHVDGEVATAKGTAKAGAMYTISTYTTKPLEDIVAASPNTPWMFQLYMAKNMDFNKYVLAKAKKLGATAIILTADANIIGNRERNIRNNYKMNSYPMPLVEEAAKSLGKDKSVMAKKLDLGPDDIKWIKEETGLPVVVKGIQHPDDAELCIQAGADAIWVSNHGARQLGGAPAAFDVLPEIVKVVDKRVPVIFDSGIREGTHIFKALASGADIVAVGRPVLYGLNLGGAEGVNSVLEKFNKELFIAMYSAGTKTIEDVKKNVLRDANQ